MSYSDFKLEILALTGIDLSLYKEKQMKRRIDALVQRLGCAGYEQYVRLLKHDPKALEFFCDYITINVTAFFRTPEHWERLCREVLPHLEQPRVWSVACSTGQEPYSLVMALAEHYPLEDIHVYATDINEKVLDIARRGIYKTEELDGVPQDYLDRYFEEAAGGYRVRDEVRRCVEFHRMNLLDPQLEMEREKFDLVVCRNVLIYFTTEAKRQLINLFLRSLKPGGILFTGKAEQILYYAQHGFDKICNWLYKKIN